MRGGDYAPYIMSPPSGEKLRIGLTAWLCPSANISILILIRAYMNGVAHCHEAGRHDEAAANRRAKDIQNL